MKKLLFGALGLVAMAAPVSAADMAMKAAPVPYIVPMYNWTGLYIGGNGGWGQSRGCVDFFTPAGVDVAEGCRERSGGVIGGQIGYRWQLNREWVIGWEAQG